MEDFEEYGEDIYLYDMAGWPRYSINTPVYNSKILYAIDFTNTKATSVNRPKPKTEILVIEPLVKELFKDYANIGFDAVGCPQILYWRKLVDESQSEETNINEYIDKLDKKLRYKLDQFDKQIDILEKIKDKYQIDSTKRNLDETEDVNGSFKSEVLFASSKQQSKQYLVLYNFVQFYECMIHDIISLIYTNIAILRHFWYADRQKINLSDEWERCKKEYLENKTPFDDWRDWYDFLRNKWYKIHYKKLKDEAKE